MKAAELKAEQAINDARMAKQLAAEAMADANEMREQNKQLKQRMLDEASWSKRPLAEATGSVVRGFGCRLYWLAGGEYAYALHVDIAGGFLVAWGCVGGDSLHGKRSFR